MVSYGDKIYINDLGLEKEIFEENEPNTYLVYLVEESDGSINWYMNPNYRDDIGLLARAIKLTDKEKKQFGIE